MKRTLATAVAGLAAFALLTTALPSYADDFSIEVISGRADMVAGGDALVRIEVKKKEKTIPLSQVTITLNGVEVSSEFIADEAARTCELR